MWLECGFFATHKNSVRPSSPNAGILVLLHSYRTKTASRSNHKVNDVVIHIAQQAANGKRSRESAAVVSAVWSCTELVAMLISLHLHKVESEIPNKKLRTRNHKVAASCKAVQSPVFRENLHFLNRRNRTKGPSAIRTVSVLFSTRPPNRQCVF